MSRTSVQRHNNPDYVYRIASRCCRRHVAVQTCREPIQLSTWVLQISAHPLYLNIVSYGAEGQHC
jgi:hypothetical protein